MIINKNVDLIPKKKDLEDVSSQQIHSQMIKPSENNNKKIVIQNEEKVVEGEINEEYEGEGDFENEGLSEYEDSNPEECMF